jgi:hypothetical protein
MELLLACTALVVGGVGLVLALRLRQEVRAASKAAASTSAATDAALAATRRELDALQRGLNELRASVLSPPPPPLPKARRGGLDDLREQLKASQQADDSQSEPEGDG